MYMYENVDEYDACLKNDPISSIQYAKFVLLQNRHYHY